MGMHRNVRDKRYCHPEQNEASYPLVDVMILRFAQNDNKVYAGSLLDWLFLLFVLPNSLSQLLDAVGHLPGKLR